MSKKSKKRRKKGKGSVQDTNLSAIHPSFQERHPNIVAAVVLVVLLLVFFNQIIFSGKMFFQSDSLASHAMNPFVEKAFEKGVYPLWNPYIFSGMPSYASLIRTPYTDVIETVIQGGTWIFQQLFNAPQFLGILINYFLLGFLFYILFRNKNFSPQIAFFACIAIVFMPQVIAYSAFGHNTKLRTAVLIPIIFLLTERLLEKKDLLSFCSLALAIGLQLLRKHIQICYYTQLMIGIYLIYHIILSLKDKAKAGRILSGTALLIAAVVLGFVISSATNLSVWEYSKYSIRGGTGTGLDFDYATNWSFPPLEIVTFFIPSFTGFGGTTYWGPINMGTSFPIYFGVIILFLAGFGLILKRNRTTWFFTLFAVIVLLISFGKHFPILFDPMFKFFPMFNKFRAPKMILVFFGFSLTILAAFGLQGLMELGDEKFKPNKNLMRYILGFGCVMILLVLILLFGKSGYLNWAAGVGENASTAYTMAVNSAIRNLVLSGLTVGIVLLVLRSQMKVKWLPFLLTVLLIIDLWIVDIQFMSLRPRADEQRFFQATRDVQFLKEQSGPFRILPIQDSRPPNWYAYHQIQSAFGYHAAKIKNYQELMTVFGVPDRFFQKYLTIVDGRYQFQKTDLVSKAQLTLHRNFLKLMNVKYILCPYPLPDEKLQVVMQPRNQGQNFVLEYTDHLPRLFFPKEIRQVKDKNKIDSMMTLSTFDPAETAIIQEMPPFRITYSDSNQARITKYDIHEIEIQADVHTPSLLVLSEVYYPAGWKAYVDGIETKIFQTDYVLRSLFLNPGHHMITLVFRPRMFHTGLLISVVTFCVLVSGIVFGFQQQKKGKRTIQHTEEKADKAGDNA